MFGIDDLSHNFEVIGLEKNEDLQKYEYSRGFGNNGQDRASTRPLKIFAKS